MCLRVIEIMGGCGWVGHEKGGCPPSNGTGTIPRVPVSPNGS